MDDISRALQHINRSMDGLNQREPLTFEDFLKVLTANPTGVIRNVFQLFYDMVMTHIGEGADEYPDDPESIHFDYYDCRRLFVEETDHPFFADRLFANRLVNLVASWKRGAQQNKIYIFEGPPGSGKSTFLNNLLMKFEEYANKEEGSRFEVVWRLDRKVLGKFAEHEVGHFLDKLSTLLDEYEFEQSEVMEAKDNLNKGDEFVEIPCPSHDNPILLIPKDYRRETVLEQVAIPFDYVVSGSYSLTIMVK